MVSKKKVLRVFQRDFYVQVGLEQGGPKFWNKKIVKFFFQKKFIRMFEPPF